MSWKSRRGAEVVEMALILPLLLIVVFGLVDFGLLVYDKAIITNAAREGARAGVVFAPNGVIAGVQRRTDAQINQVIQDYCSTYLITFGASTLNTAIEPVESTRLDTVVSPTGQELRVTLTYPHQFVVMSYLIPGLNNITLTSTARMRME